MKSKFLFLALIILCAGCSSIHNGYKKSITLDNRCSFENRKIVDSIKDQVGELSWQNDFYIIAIQDQKYIACNLPAAIQTKTILLSGNVLEILPNERLMAKPLRVTKASYK